MNILHTDAFNHYMYDLLKELNHQGVIRSIEPGDAPVRCYQKVVK